MGYSYEYTTPQRAQHRGALHWHTRPTRTTTYVYVQHDLHMALRLQHCDFAYFRVWQVYEYLQTAHEHNSAPAVHMRH